MRALLLEDDESSRIMFSACLHRAGHEVLECATIAEALTCLRTRQIDLLVLDLLIDNTNCLGVARYAGYAAPEAEIILITGSEKFANGELLTEFPGINWILRKPVPLDDLEAFVAFARLRHEKRTQKRA